MNKENVLKQLESNPLNLSVWIDDKKLSLIEYAKENYKPWDLNLFSNKDEIHESWFPNQDRNSVTGDYFGLYPSLPMWSNEGFTVDGVKVADSDVVFSQSFCGTGASLQVYNKKT